NEELTVDDILGAEQTSDAAGADAADAVAAPVDPLEDMENPYLEDLRRLSAEYANYRKRTEANVDIDKQRATAAAVVALLPVLDDLDRAEQHGDLEEGSAFTAIAQKLRGTLERLGLQNFGEKGELFDPQVHEAIAQVPVPGTEEHTVLDVIERGYRIGDVELRPAKVAVAVGADG
ncbi:MAG: nucleotide exchange factor GrpE, partial [Leucobacter sp.]